MSLDECADTLRYLECMVCGPLEIEQEGASRFAANSHSCIALDAPLELMIDYYDDAYISGWRSVTIIEKVTLRCLFRSVIRRSLKQERLCVSFPYDLLPEAHHLAVCTVRQGLISWRGRRLIYTPTSQE